MSSAYDEIYRLQDEILDVVFAGDSLWYLTGGTALSRFHLQHRYSDDLDFFSLETSSFTEVFREEREKIIRKWSQAEIQVDSRDFKRLLIKRESVSVKLDFVCDRTARIGRPEQRGVWKIDTVRNIASNKIGAVLGRDEPRDAADILAICRARKFSWNSIIEEALEKENFALEDIVYRFKTFPLDWLDRVPFYAARNSGNDRNDWSVITQDLADLGSNSLAGPDCGEI